MKALLFFCLILFPFLAWAEDPHDKSRIYWMYEVGNQIRLADFEMGSGESIRDQDGNGFGMSWVIKEGKIINLALDLGQSNTLYRGKVEDGVDIEFVPQAGSGYDTLSSSTNVVYDFDVAFQNPYIGLSVVFKHFRFGGGRLFQKSEGEVNISSQGVHLAKATYETKTQLYFWGGAEFNLDDLYVGLYLRNFEAPSLIINDCNEQALGTLACDRIRGATGNRNQRTTLFGGGIIHLGWMF